MSDRHDDPHASDYLWDGSGAVDPEIERLERLLAPLAHQDPPANLRAVPAELPAPAPGFLQRHRLGLTLAALAPVLAAAVAIAWLGGRPAPAPTVRPTGEHTAGTRRVGLPATDATAWPVDVIMGQPACGGDDCAALHVGEWLTTDAASRARVRVADIGSLDVAPGSRLRLVASHPAQHRLELARGAIHAVVTAPPRLLIIDTPSARAVDLGCAYTLTVDDAGATLLEVTLGRVALEAPGRHVMVPAGASARTRRGHAPGTPLFADAPAELVAAAGRLDDAPDDDQALTAALASARPRDTLTLWHLVPLVPAGEPRAALVERIATLSETPPTCPDERAELERAEPEALEAWRLRMAHTW